MFWLAGMPPTAGFFAKFRIFRGAISQGEIVPAVLGILTSVASLFYYLRVVVAMYMPPAEHGREEAPAPARCQYVWSSNVLIVLAGLVTLVIGVLPGLLTGLLY